MEIGGYPTGRRRRRLFVRRRLRRRLARNEPGASLDGLDGLLEIDTSLEISGNAVLSDVTSLYDLVRVGTDVTITFNKDLGDDAAEALVDEIDTIGGAVTIFGN